MVKTIYQLSLAYCDQIVFHQVLFCDLQRPKAENNYRLIPLLFLNHLTETDIYLWCSMGPSLLKSQLYVGLRYKSVHKITANFDSRFSFVFVFLIDISQRKTLEYFVSYLSLMIVLTTMDRYRKYVKHTLFSSIYIYI